MAQQDGFSLTFLGSGCAFYFGECIGENWQSNLLIQSPSGRRLLLDCGTDIRFSLGELGLTASDIHDVYISHLHGDHIGGLEWLGFGTKFAPNAHKPHIWGAQSTLKYLWAHSLRGGLGNLEGEMATINTYFTVHALPDNGCFQWEGIVFRLVQVVHVMNGFKISPTYGLLFTLGNTRIFFTADTQFAPSQINLFYQSADLILQDCETDRVRSGVHAHYDELLTLPSDIRRKMWLYHYQPGPRQDARDAGFAGWAAKGQRFHFPVAQKIAA